MINLATKIKFWCYNFFYSTHCRGGSLGAFDMKILHPSNGGPKYTMDTSVLPYTADTDGYRRLSGNPKSIQQVRKEFSEI